MNYWYLGDYSSLIKQGGKIQSPLVAKVREQKWNTLYRGMP